MKAIVETKYQSNDEFQLKKVEKTVSMNIQMLVRVYAEYMCLPISRLAKKP